MGIVILLHNEKGPARTAQSPHQTLQEKKPLLLSHIAVKKLFHGGKEEGDVPLPVLFRLGHRLEDVVGRKNPLHEDRGKKGVCIYAVPHGLIGQTEDIEADGTIDNEDPTPPQGQMGHPEVRDVTQSRGVSPQKGNPTL